MRKWWTRIYKYFSNQGRIRISKDKFQDPKWKRHDEIGYNYRFEISAAVALAQTERLKFFVKKRMQSGNA